MRIHFFTAPFLFPIAHTLSCDLLSFTFGLALIRMGFFVHFILPHARGDHFALGAAGVAHGLRHGLYGGERACEAAADDVCGIHDEEKGMRVDFFNVVTELRDLCQIDDGKDDALIHAREGALPVEEGRTVVNVAEDGVCDLKRLVRNDEGGFPLGEADDETAREVRIDVHRDQGADGELQGKDPGTGHDDQEVQRKDDVADLQIEVFLQDRADDIEAAGVAVVAVEEPHAKAKDDAAGDGRDERLFHGGHGGKRCGEVDEDGAEHGAYDGDQGIEFPHELQGKKKDRDVQDEVCDTDGKARQVVQDHRDAGEPACEKVMGDIEGIDADGVEKCPDHGDGQDEKQPLPESGASVVSPQRGVHEWVLSLKNGSTKGAVRIFTSYYITESKET